jgi:ABC-type antimicrobial peptide transport system permease subunit
MAMIAARGTIPKIFPLEDKLRSSPAGVLDASSDLHLPSWQLHIPWMWSGLQVSIEMIAIILPERFVFPVIYAIALSFISEIYPTYAMERLDPVEAIGIE